MKVVTLSEAFEQTFWSHVNQDPLDYYFFILDMKQSRDQTKIFLVMDGLKVEGLMLVFADYVVQLRGSRKAIKKLLNKLSLEKVELQSPLDCEDLVLEKYRPQTRHEGSSGRMILMRVGRGEENVQITHEPARLQAQDAECAAEIMRKADPEWWGDIEIERLRERLETRFWLGIEQDGKIVSVGGMQFVDFASNINAIATDEAYRNRGFATSITSALVKEILKNSPAAIIHVLADNAPAVRAYSKVGFKPYKTYFSMHGDLIKT